MPAPISVLHEDNHCLAVNKPGGLLTAGDRTGDPSLLELARRYIREKYRKPGRVYLGLVHRLDRPVSGVVIIARTSKAAARLSGQFRDGTIIKIYHAWVGGVPDPLEGRLSGFLVKDRDRNTVRVVPATVPGAWPVALTYRTLRRSGSGALLELEPATGRPHQIRAQLAACGLPIAGDVKYGGARVAAAGRIALHASRLTFQHPTRNERVTVSAPLPDFWKSFTGPIEVSDLV